MNTLLSAQDIITKLDEAVAEAERKVCRSPGIMSEITLDAATDARWYVLFFMMMNADALGLTIDTVAIARRLDQIRAERARTTA